MAFKGTRTLGTKDYERERPLLEELDRLQGKMEQERERLRADGLDEATSPNLKELRQAFLRPAGARRTVGRRQ